jgi:plastocyanin
VRPRRNIHRSAAAAALAVVILAAILLAPAGCGTSGAKMPVSEVTAKPDSEGVQVVEVEAHSFYFKPNRIVVEAGKPVELTIKFKSFFTPHNMTCVYADAGITIDKSAGFMSFKKTKSVRFTPTTPGEYAFHCGVDSHTKKGMTGTLVVR